MFDFIDFRELIFIFLFGMVFGFVLGVILI
jgi:hypothetical protein